MRRIAHTLISAAFIVGLVGPAAAQAIPAGQTCGGLLCDMGVLGRKVPVGPDGTPPSDAQMVAAEASDPHRLPCNDFFCRAFGSRQAEAAPPAPVQAEPMRTETMAPTKMTSAKKKHHAKVASRTAAPEAAKPDAKDDPAAR
jgi:hypothetical protein